MVIQRWGRRLLLTAAALLWGTTVLAEHDHEHSTGEFDVFLAAEAFKSSGDLRRGDDDPWMNADIVFGLTKHQFRIFGEYFITPEEHDLERFQVGYEFAPETTLWIGRYHQPASAWNTEHHHGRYLQTAITRPSIEFWEDQHGLIPQHITGALLESRIPIGEESAIQFSSGVGVGPSIRGTTYEPIALLDDNPGRHRVSITSRLAYMPEYVGATSAGLLFGRHQLEIQGAALTQALAPGRAVLGIYGAYVDWNKDPWRIIAASYYVDVKLSDAARNESFGAGYAQVERQLQHRLTVYGRTENSARMRYSRFVGLFDDGDRDIDMYLRRHVLGLRWDYARRQALSVEIAHANALTYRANEFRALWSAAVP